MLFWGEGESQRGPNISGGQGPDPGAHQVLVHSCASRHQAVELVAQHKGGQRVIEQPPGEERSQGVQRPLHCLTALWETGALGQTLLRRPRCPGACSPPSPPTSPPGNPVPSPLLVSPSWICSLVRGPRQPPPKEPKCPAPQPPPRSPDFQSSPPPPQGPRHPAPPPSRDPGILPPRGDPSIFTNANCHKAITKFRISKSK